MRSDRPQNRAGREVAEDAKRAVRRAFECVGLKPCQVRMIMAQDQKARFILGGANPQGWAYDIPALSVEFWVTTSGRITPVKVFCDAGDDDPTTSTAFGVLAVKDCVCRLEELPEILKGVWAEREELVARQKAGERVRSFTGRFRWRWTTMDGVLGGEN
jgi:hypothetical protein